MKKQKEDQPEVTRLQRVIENSSRILEIDWQRSTNIISGKKCYKQAGILFVTFKGGKKYGYSGVKVELVQELVDANSLGKFFDEHIKGKYNWFMVPSDDSGKPLEINIIQNKD